MNIYHVYYDGGTHGGNPGQGYGSYQVRKGDEIILLDSLTFTEVMSNNRAEYQALINALSDLNNHLSQADERDAQIEIFGDSQLVIKQLQGIYRVKEPALIQPYKIAQALLALFPQAKLTWKPRTEIVAVLGH